MGLFYFIQGGELLLFSQPPFQFAMGFGSVGNLVQPSDTTALCNFPHILPDIAATLTKVGGQVQMDCPVVLPYPNL